MTRKNETKCLHLITNTFRTETTATVECEACGKVLGVFPVSNKPS